MKGKRFNDDAVNLGHRAHREAVTLREADGAGAIKNCVQTTSHKLPIQFSLTSHFRLFSQRDSHVRQTTSSNFALRIFRSQTSTCFHNIAKIYPEEAALIFTAVGARASLDWHKLLSTLEN